MKCKNGWRDDFEHVGHPFQTTVGTAAGGTAIPTGTGNWIAQCTVSAGRVSAVDGEPGVSGIIKLVTGNTANSQTCLFKGIRQNLVQSPIFGATPGNMIRCLKFRMKLPAPFTDNLGFRMAWTNNPLFPEVASDTIAFLFDRVLPANDPNMHCMTRANGGFDDTPITPPTPQGWVDFAVTQDTPGTLEFWVAGVNVATHTGPSVPDIAALVPSVQIFNRNVAGAKEIWFDSVEFDPVLVPALEECDPECPEEFYEVMNAWGAASNNYVVGKSSQLCPNVLEATQDIASSGNPPSPTNRVQILVLPGQYLQSLPPAPPVPIPGYTTLCGFTSGFCNTEFLQAQFVVDGTDVNFVNFFFASEQSVNVPHIDCAGHTSIVLENIQHFGKQPLLYQSGTSWRTVVMRRCGSTFSRSTPAAFGIDVSGQVVNNCDFLLEYCRLDMFEWAVNGGADQGCVRFTNVKDVRILGGEARVNNNGICWRIVGAGSNLIQFKEGHSCNNRFPGNFPSAKSVVSDTPHIYFSMFDGINCTFPGGIPGLIPQPVLSVF